MYKQHMHMVYGELYIYIYQVLDQNANDNAYSTPLRHKVWNVYPFLVHIPNLMAQGGLGKHYHLRFDPKLDMG